MKFEFTKMKNAMLIGSVIACLHNGYGQVENSDLAEVVAALQGEDYDARYEARMVLQDHVSDVSVPGMEAERVEMEKKIASLLEGDFPVTTQLWLLRQLNSIGSEASVDVLAALLNDEDPHVADGARMALEFNSSDAATAALMNGLDAAKGDTQILGFINSLAERGDGAAIGSIVKYSRGDNVDIANAAVIALGKLGKENPAQARRAKLYVNLLASSADKATIERSLLQISNDWAKCSQLAREGANDAIRAAAFQKCIELGSGRAAKLLTSILADEGPEGKSSLLRVALLSGKSNVARAALKLVEEMDAESQAVVVGSLAASKKSSRNEKTILAIAESDSEPLQLQAILALGKIGSAASFPILMEMLDSRSRDLREAAGDAIGSIKDSKFDRNLMASARKGDDADRITAIRGLSYRNSNGAADLVNEIAASDESDELREVAVTAMERIGDEASLTTLVDLIVIEPKSGGLRRDAQSVLKRSTLRMGDPDTAWKAMKAGLDAAGDDREARDALLAVIDSAPTSESIDYLRQLWLEGDETVQKNLLRVLPVWRNWDGGFLMLEFASLEGVTEELKDSCYSGIGRLILSADQTYSLKRKFELADKCLAESGSEERKQAILNGFRNAKWREKNYATRNDVAPELKELLVE